MTHDKLFGILTVVFLVAGILIAGILAAADPDLQSLPFFLAVSLLPALVLWTRYKLALHIERRTTTKTKDIFATVVSLLAIFLLLILLRFITQ